MIEVQPHHNRLDELLSIEEHDEMVLNALLGSIVDLRDEYQQEDRNRSDGEILSAVLGVYQAGSAHYNGELAKTIQLFDQFAARLGELACNHDHLMQTALNVDSQEHGDNDNHDHSSDEKDDDEWETGPDGIRRHKKKKFFASTHQFAKR